MKPLLLIFYAKETDVFNLEFISVNWWQVLSHFVHLMVAYTLALPIGLDRQMSKRHFGLRTFPLVAVVSCGFMLVGMDVISTTDGEARVIQGIITGIGFIGGGAILKNNGHISGMASAASIWNTGAIGLAVAFDHFEIALVLSLLNFMTLRWVKKLKDPVENIDEDSS